MIFSTTTADAVNAIQTGAQNYPPYQYKIIQDSSSKWLHWAEENYFKINNKTKIMISEKDGSSQPAKDKIYYIWEIIKTVYSYKYPVITLLTTWTIFTVYIKQKALSVIQASHT
jgi:hypothetical protein